MPILPSGEYVPGSTSSDTLLLDSSENTRQNESYFHPQMSPIMSERTFYDIEERVSEIIGNGEFPEDKMMYLFSEPGNEALFNPPVVCFAFAALPGVIGPDEIEVSINDENISSKIHYNYYYHPGREVNYYLAHYKPEEYLNPDNQHHVNISFNPQKAGSLNKNIEFSVPQDDRLRILRAGFHFDKTKRTPMLDKLIVIIGLPQDVKFDNRLLNPQNWGLAYSDKEPLSDIASIEKIDDDTFVISFSADAKPKSDIEMFFSPADGIFSQPFEFKSPGKNIQRGGSANRSAMSDCCTGHFFEGTAHSAEDCEDYHTYVNLVDCPDYPCDGLIVETGTKTIYDIHNDYYLEGKDISTATTDTIQFNPPTMVCRGFYNSYFSYRDYDINFDLYGFDENGDYCGHLDHDGPIHLQSDIIHPTVTAVISEETLLDEGGSELPCSMRKRYMVTVTGDDDHCIERDPLFYYFFKGDKQCSPNPLSRLLDVDARHNPPQSDHHFERRYFIMPNTLACVNYMKVVMFDKKGNWNTTKVVSYPDTVFDQLPYPTELTLSFDDEHRESNRQYVNLDVFPFVPIDQQVCAYKMDHPDHGSLIYLEISVTPPIYGITVFITYEDPLFEMGSNILPTNIVDDPYNPSQYWSSGHNPDLTPSEFKLLWGSHAAYAGDNLTLGDNYNYFTDGSVSCSDFPDCKEDDPINDGHVPQIPCFWTFYCPPGFMCEDSECLKTGIVPLKTNIFGKAATYFETQGHGGDNFKFKAYTISDVCEKECLLSEPEDVFTVWRRMTVDYAWMADRNGRYPVNDQGEGLCKNPAGAIQPEHEGDHQIGSGDFNMYKGVFDDCFLEIEEGGENGNLPYELVLNGGYDPPDDKTTYDYASWWYPERDEVLMLGIDHLNYKCVNIKYGDTTCGSMSEREFYSYVAVGNRDDVYMVGGYDFIDGKTYGYDPLHDSSSLAIPCLNTAAHELTHNIIRIGNPYHEIPYGLMYAGDAPFVSLDGEDDKVPGRRFYLHSIHIMDFRASIPFDSLAY